LLTSEHPTFLWWLILALLFILLETFSSSLSQKRRYLSWDCEFILVLHTSSVSLTNFPTALAPLLLFFPVFGTCPRAFIAPILLRCSIPSRRRTPSSSTDSYAVFDGHDAAASFFLSKLSHGSCPYFHPMPRPPSRPFLCDSHRRFEVWDVLALLADFIATVMNSSCFGTAICPSSLLPFFVVYGFSPSSPPSRWKIARIFFSQEGPVIYLAFFSLLPSDRPRQLVFFNLSSFSLLSSSKTAFPRFCSQPPSTSQLFPSFPFWAPPFCP